MTTRDKGGSRVKSWGGGGEQNQEEAKCRRKQDRGRRRGRKEEREGEMGAGNREEGRESRGRMLQGDL